MVSPGQPGIVVGDQLPMILRVPPILIVDVGGAVVVAWGVVFAGVVVTTGVVFAGVVVTAVVVVFDEQPVRIIPETKIIAKISNANFFMVSSS